MIYAAGCSMVFGSDLESMTPYEEDNRLPSNEYKHARRESFAWPNTLGKSLGQSVVNAGSSGACQYRIMRTLMTDLERFDPEYTLVLVGLTEPQRFEFYEDNQFHKVVLPRGSYKKLRRNLRRYAEDHAFYNFQDVPAFVRYVTYVLATQSYLQVREFKYAFVNSLDQYLEQAENIPQACSLVRQIDMSKVIPDSMYALCKRENVPFGGTLHPLAIGHRLWSNHVRSHLVQMYPSLA